MHSRVKRTALDATLLVTLTIGELLLPEERVMQVTRHSSAKQMRKDYGTALPSYRI